MKFSFYSFSVFQFDFSNVLFFQFQIVISLRKVWVFFVSVFSEQQLTWSTLNWVHLASVGVLQTFSESSFTFIWREEIYPFVLIDEKERCWQIEEILRRCNALLCNVWVAQSSGRQKGRNRKRISMIWSRNRCLFVRHRLKRISGVSICPGKAKYSPTFRISLSLSRLVTRNWSRKDSEIRLACSSRDTHWCTCIWDPLERNSVVCRCTPTTRCISHTIREYSPCSDRQPSLPPLKHVCPPKNCDSNVSMLNSLLSCV